jgi:outer membrane receptor protein involved in Fe transport
MQETFTSYEDFTNKSLGLNIEFTKDVSFISRWLEKKSQNFYGYGAWPIHNDPKQLQNTSFVNELRYTPKLSETLLADIKVGYKQYEYEGLSRLRPFSLLGYPNDLIGRGYYKEYSIYSDVALKYKSSNNELLIGVYALQAKANNTSYFVNNPNISEATIIELPTDGLKANLTRNQYAFYFNNIYTISDLWTADFGLRYDY